MIGLDFGSTTSRAMIARTRVGQNRFSGTLGAGTPEIIYRSEPLFTPFVDDVLHVEDVLACLELWLKQSGTCAEDIFCGGLIITGLAARGSNAETIAAAVEQRLCNFIVATAADAGLESWLAYMGNTQRMSQAFPRSQFMNLDIGGGTTNIAVGRNGNVSEVGCFHIGARHFRFQPGSYTLAGVSEIGRQLADYYGFSAEVGRPMVRSCRHLILDLYIDALLAIVHGDQAFFQCLPGSLLVDLPSGWQGGEDLSLTFSGGVGELLYKVSEGGALPATIAAFGDLGIDLAERILQEPELCRHLKGHVPENRGQSTVYGLAIHSAEISGHSVHLPSPSLLPLRHLPVIGRLCISASKDDVAQAIAMAARCTAGSCLQIIPEAGSYPSLMDVRRLGQHLAEQLKSGIINADTPLLLIAPMDFGKVLGSYATEWGRIPVTLIVVDEVQERSVQFVSLGCARNYVIPVYYYGMH
ncbi:ethanolamine ammonia-lyase reactivating factor EutA [Parendozoicomonas haliclonae]|uniref:Reactivating factor for ethanolamine ammonia lyase n=1 Tax=Parendozoicomonas haliclonae TaxID=1960125 RepID=A0A1X7AM08_9GAMM|nr:ethanolamine ammonia-lyase reactivating factor EutA [Parendozoicomonas haliclonae]SMA48860.1 reactivating factor for ethanolamine ammonia lyase [Parendozoicomonas haliclonae]